MELLLNLVWLSVCLLMVGGCLACATDYRKRRDWHAWVALGLLLVVLFPAISMTDDLLAQQSGAEFRDVLRRHDAAGGGSVLYLALEGTLLALVALLGALNLRGGDDVFAVFTEALARLRKGVLRTAGVRPPPALRFAR